MATRLQAIIDFAYKSGGVEQAQAALGKLSNAGKTVGQSISSGASQATGALNGLLSTGKALGQAWSDLATPVNQSLEIFQKVGQAAQQAYAYISEGTQLGVVEGKFEALANSINTTADALLNDLRAATRGTVSDFDLMGGASSLVSLGLTNTSEDTIRLTKLIGQLGWDMNQVTLTLANQSTMRLDALGLSVSDVTGRVDALKAAGMSADEAFKFAIIEAGEEKLNMLGDAADTAAGKLKILETNAQNFGDSFKKTFGENFVGNLNAAAGGIFETEESASGLGETLANIATNVSFLGFIRFVKEDVADLGVFSRNTSEQISGMGGVVERLPPSLDSAAAGIKRFGDETKVSRQSVIEATAAVDGWMLAMNGSSTLTAQAARERAAEGTATYQASDAYGELQDKVFQTSQSYDMWAYGLRATNLELQNQANAVPTVTGAIYASTEAVAAYTAATGDYVTTAINAGDEGVNLNQVMYDSLDAAGGSAEALVGLALATGQLTEAQAENILKQAAMIEYAKALGEQIAAGTISISDAVTSLADFQAGLEGSNVMVNTTTGSVQLLDDALIGSSSSVGSLQTSLDEFNTSNAVGATQALIDKLNSIPNSIPVEIVVTGEVPRATGGYQDLGGGNQGPGFAGGADFVVPPGYPNDSYPMRVQSGEHVTVTPAGQQRGGNTYNLYVTAMDGGANVSREFNYLKSLAGA